MNFVVMQVLSRLFSRLVVHWALLYGLGINEGIAYFSSFKQASTRGHEKEVYDPYATLAAAAMIPTSLKQKIGTNMETPDADVALVLEVVEISG